VRGKLVPQDPKDEPASGLLKRIANEKARLVKGMVKRSQEESDSPGADLSAFDLPVGWEWSKPNEFSLKITDGEHFRPPTLDSGILFLSAKDIREEGVSLADPLFVSKETAAKARARCDPDYGDILIVSRGATCGRICRVNIKEMFCLLGSVILIKPSPFIDGGYLECALRSPMIFAALVSASGATAQGAIYLRDLKKIAIPLPPLDEQHRIVAKVDELMAICDRLETSLNTGDEARRSLLDALLNDALMPVEGVAREQAKRVVAAHG
jgi:type I restriction enzyme S subunit